MYCIMKVYGFTQQYWNPIRGQWEPHALKECGIATMAEAKERLDRLRLSTFERPIITTL